MAERVNRTIKEEVLLNRSFVNYEAASEAIQRAIENYNRLRPHRGCNYHTPEQAHRMQGELIKKWRIKKGSQPEKIQQREPSLANRSESKICQEKAV